jgi:hypothetical protein
MEAMARMTQYVETPHFQKEYHPLTIHVKDFFVRDIEIRSRNGSPNIARCRLDSQCEVPLLVSEHWARENDKWPEVSSDFHDPGM